MNMNFFPVEVKEVPSKKELNSLVAVLQDSTEYRDIEKYVWLKGLEYFVKEGIKNLQPKAITSYLEMVEGSITEQIMGVEVKVTKERINKTLEKFTYSDKVTHLEQQIEKKENELKVLKEKLKLQQVMEVNHGIAKKEVWEESSEPELSIRVTLRK